MSGCVNMSVNDHGRRKEGKKEEEEKEEGEKEKEKEKEEGKVGEG